MQRTVSTTFISLPLAKYSRSTDAVPNAADFTWSHITTDLCIVIDTFRGATNAFGAPSQQLKVVHGSQIRESIPVEELVRQSHNFITTMRHLNAEVKNEHLPISALVRRPLLAFRWNLPEPSTMVRRIQLRFKTNADFDTVYNHLRGLGLSMSDPRPATASSTSSLKPMQSLSSPQPRSMDTANRPSTISSSTTTPRVSSPLARNSIHHSRSSDLAPGIPEDHQPSVIASHSFNPVIPPEYFQRPDSGVSSMGIQPDVSTSVSSELPVTHHFSFTPFVPRSITATRPNSDNMLPPRRELPFDRSLPNSSGNDHVRPSTRSSGQSARPEGLPKSSGSERNRPTSRASSTSMGPPPIPPTSSSGVSLNTHVDLPIPTFTPEAFESPRPSSSSSRPSSSLLNLPPLPSPTFVNADEREVNMGRSPQQLQTPSSTARETSRPLSGISSGQQNARSSPSPTQLPTPRSETAYQDRVIQGIINAENENGDEVLHSYATKAADERRTMLDDFMMGLIDDDNFLTLVEDVSTCWTRIGLGLG